MSTTAVAGEPDGRTLCAPTAASNRRGAQRAPLKLRPLAIPNEHGGWGFLFEPIVLAALAAPSVAAMLVAVAAVAAFLTRHPLKLAAADLVRGRRYPRTVRCAQIATAYSIVAIGAIAAAVRISGLAVLMPLALAAPFAIVQLAYDAENRGRTLLPELAGALAMGGVAASMAVASAAPTQLAAALWLLSICRSIPAILYVRSLLGRGRGAVVAHVAAAVVALLLWHASLAPIAAVIATLALFARALHRPSTPAPKKIGVAELLWGGAATLAMGLGYALH